MIHFPLRAGRSATIAARTPSSGERMRQSAARRRTVVYCYLRQATTTLSLGGPRMALQIEDVNHAYPDGLAVEYLIDRLRSGQRGFPIVLAFNACLSRLALASLIMGGLSLQR